MKITSLQLNLLILEFDALNEDVFSIDGSGSVCETEISYINDAALDSSPHVRLFKQFASLYHALKKYLIMKAHYPSDTGFLYQFNQLLFDETPFSTTHDRYLCLSMILASNNFLSLIFGENHSVQFSKKIYSSREFHRLLQGILEEENPYIKFILENTLFNDVINHANKKLPLEMASPNQIIGQARAKLVDMEIRKNARLLVQAMRTGTSFFSTLPETINKAIVAFSASNALNPVDQQVSSYFKDFQTEKNDTQDKVSRACP